MRPNDDLVRRWLFRHAAREDLLAFSVGAFPAITGGAELTPSWHHAAIADVLEDVALGWTRRLIITLPPRSLKSTFASIAYPAWLLGRDPRHKIICVSYSQALAIKHANDTRALMRSPVYREIFPGTQISRAKDTEAEFHTTRRGFRVATSVGGTLTGRGGQTIIVDDPMSAAEAMSDSERPRINDWFRTTLFSRLDDKRRGGIVIVTQRLHAEDLVGSLLAEGADSWKVLNLPAIAPATRLIHLGIGWTKQWREGELLDPVREPSEVIETLRRDLGSQAFSAQYLQDPVPPGGNMVNWSWFRTFESTPKRGSSDTILQSWDTASSERELADWSVCTTWLVRGELMYLVDLVRIRAGYPDLRRRVLAERQRWRPDTILVEDKGSGMSLIQDLKHEGIALTAVPVEVGKVMRMAAQAAHIEKGAVFVPVRAPWLSDLKAELLAFPLGQHDDQVDSISQAIGWVRRPVVGVTQRKMWG